MSPGGRLFLVAAALSVLAVSVLSAQDRLDETTVLDSVVVVGANRFPPGAIIGQSAIPLGEPVSFRDLQRAIYALFETGQFDDIRASQATINGKEVLQLEVVERPILANWSVRGAEKISEKTVRGQIKLLEGRPYDPAEAYIALAKIDSLYQKKGFYLADHELVELPQEDSLMRVVFDISEGRRVAVSQIVVEGNTHFSDGDVAGSMETGTEGFFWWKTGEYNEDRLEQDLRERLPVFYGSRGHVDFQVLRDTLVVYEPTGKGTLILSVDEGDPYLVGGFEIVGNRRFSTDELEQFYPFGERTTGFLGLGGKREGPATFDQGSWDQATQRVREAYFNNGYIYAQITPVLARRTDGDGDKRVDLRWQIVEGQPAVVNKVVITGNSITHEDVIRRAIVVVPGDIFRQDALVRSYQSISNLGFFEQPVPPPDTRPANDQGDVDVIFEVTEKRTGNINFGASVGQGTGLGGFIGLEEPNLFGKAKQVSLQWQFGRNINDFKITYTDPALRGSLMSGTLNLHNTRLRYTIADLGRITTRGGSLRIGLPLFGSRWTRFFTSYTLEESNFDSPTLAPRFNCANCVLSSLGFSIARDTRIELPFATAGSFQELRFSQSGGPLGGSGNFRRAMLEGRWYAPLARLGASPTSSGLTFVLGLTTKAGFVWGDAGPHFRQLFTLGGTQFGIPLRGYDEFSITPQGFDPNAQGSSASTVDAFGQSYLTMTAEVGMRVSQALYLNTFFDAGNVWSSPGQLNPTRLFRGLGFGVSVLSPLGPLGLDLARGLDRIDAFGAPNPGWKLHFKLGNFF